MMMYLLLFAGLFMGWSLGTNDAANAFGTAVATRVIKYRTAVTIIAVLVVVGAFAAGANNIDKVAELATSNKVTATTAEVYAAIEAGEAQVLQLKSAMKAAIIFACAGITVFIMSYLQFPVSANQSITGAIIGWGLFHANYSDPAVLAVNLPQIGKFAATWVLNPLGAGIISFVLVKFVNRFLTKKLLTLGGYDMIIKTGYLIAGAFASFSIGMNSSANVTALYYDAAFMQTGVAANLLTDARLTATIGGIAIAVGVLTFSKRVMMTVGGNIAAISQLDGFLVIIGMALTVVIMGNWMGIPVSTSQAVVGAVIGAGLVRGTDNIHFSVLKRIAMAWVSSPTVAGVLTYIVAVVTQGYFAA
ncbi:MAG: anion permease [Clostridia bacterium]|nr:anion permease [Clostridia bacterium]